MSKVLRTAALLPMFAMLAGCNLVVMQPSGDVAVQQRNLVVASTALMLLICIPVMVLTALFAWHYREQNKDAVYDPEWHHSTQLEVVIWTGPLIIIVALGAMTWISTHTLDPFRPLARLEPGHPVPRDEQPLTVQVVALDWKWLFVYPEQGIATVNELAAPVNRQIEFKITASSVFNTFYVPALAGMIYAMPGMETKLYAVMNKAGEYDGLSGHYSGSGFSRMTFKFQGLSADDFGAWVNKVKESGSGLTQAAYIQLERPSEANPVTYYGSVAEGLYDSVVNMCAIPGKMCLREMMTIDAKGGAGVESHENRERLEYDFRHIKMGDEPPGATVPDSGRPPRGDVQPQGMQPRSEGPTRPPGQNAPTNVPAPATAPHNH